MGYHSLVPCDSTFQNSNPKRFLRLCTRIIYETTHFNIFTIFSIIVMILSHHGVDSTSRESCDLGAPVPYSPFEDNQYWLRMWTYE